jgi:hypothetical protein
VNDGELNDEVSLLVVTKLRYLSVHDRRIAAPKERAQSEGRDCHRGERAAKEDAGHDE